MYDEQITVVNAIRGAFEKFKHHKEFTNRVRPFLEEVLPEYTLSIDVDKVYSDCFRYAIKVWGKGIPYESCVYLRWSDLVNSKRQPWQEGLQFALNVADQRDYAERELHEKHLIPDLERLNAEVIDRIRAARILIETLPIPVAATVRNSQAHWSSPSSSLAKRFPVLFKTNIGE